MNKSTSPIYAVGIDPGWTNLGAAVVKQDASGISKVFSKVYSPRDYTDEEFPDILLRDIADQIHDIGGSADPISLTIERYVSYQNITTAEAENILMLIGALRFAAHQAGYSVSLHRAIDWKMELVKTLVKYKGFDNPSSQLDKKFSIAAAKACLDVPTDFETDHEADAICLASLPLLRQTYRIKSGAPAIARAG